MRPLIPFGVFLLMFESEVFGESLFRVRGLQNLWGSVSKGLSFMYLEVCIHGMRSLYFPRICVPKIQPELFIGLYSEFEDSEISSFCSVGLVLGIKRLVFRVYSL